MKKEYFIWICGTDSSYLTRFLDDSEYELVKSIIDGLDTQYEGCGIELLPDQDKIKELSLKLHPKKPGYLDFNEYLQIIDTEYPEKGVLWKDYVYSQISRYITEGNK